MVMDKKEDSYGKTDENHVNRGASVFKESRLKLPLIMIKFFEMET